MRRRNADEETRGCINDKKSSPIESGVELNGGNHYVGRDILSVDKFSLLISRDWLLVLLLLFPPSFVIYKKWLRSSPNSFDVSGYTALSVLLSPQPFRGEEVNHMLDETQRRRWCRRREGGDNRRPCMLSVFCSFGISVSR